MNFRFVASAAVLVLIAGACGSDDVAAPADDSLPAVDDGQPPATTVEAPDVDVPGDGPDDTVQGSWLLVQLTIDGEEVPVLADWPVTLTIEGGQIGGTAACNSYGGTLQTDAASGGPFVVDELFSTEMGCEPVVMELEQRYLAALQSVDSFELADGLYLEAVGGAGASLHFMREAPVPDAELVGTRWTLDTVLSGDSASNSPDMDSAFLEFAEDGTIAGTTGCRRLGGTWTSKDATVQIASLTAIDDPAAGVCSPESDSLDRQIMSVVEAGVSVAIEGQRLTLLAPSGDGLSFRT